jgi:hypothetical protein
MNENDVCKTIQAPSSYSLLKLLQNHGPKDLRNMDASNVSAYLVASDERIELSHELELSNIDVTKKIMFKKRDTEEDW